MDIDGVFQTQIDTYFNDPAIWVDRGQIVTVAPASRAAP